MLQRAGDLQLAGAAGQLPQFLVGRAVEGLLAGEERGHLRALQADLLGQAVERQVVRGQDVHHLEMDEPGPAVEGVGVLDRGPEFAAVHARQVERVEVVVGRLQFGRAHPPVPVEVGQDRRHVLAEAGGPGLDLPVGVHVDRADVDVRAREPVDRPSRRGDADDLRAELRAPGLGVVEQRDAGRHHPLAEVQRVAQPVAGVVGLAERPDRPRHERLAAEGLLVPGVQLVPDVVVHRDDRRLSPAESRESSVSSVAGSPASPRL